MQKILEGLRRFQTEVFPERQELFQKLAEGQQPLALFLTCADSRIDPSLITQTDPGELFICRNAGNIVPPHTGETGGMTASIEYAVAALNIPHIIICGHTSCGAMTGAMNPEMLTGLPHVRKWMTYAEAAVRVVERQNQGLSEQDKLRAIIEQNVRMQMRHCETHPHVAARLATGTLQIHGWVYEIETGGVLVYDPDSAKFQPVGREPGSKAEPGVLTSDGRGRFI